MSSSIALTASSTSTFRGMMQTLASLWWLEEPFDRGEVHAQKITDPQMVTRELRDVVLDIDLSYLTLPGWQDMIKPNLPWAEDHFNERISGEPLNPPPSHEWWPFNRAGNAEHLINGEFSHSYPERFWPKRAAAGSPPYYECMETGQDHHGIRFNYGDLGDLVQVLNTNPRSRQAYLPVWFPEDLAAAIDGQRVPCTLGYHFMQHPDGRLHTTYYMRSCDLVRFFRDDVYMAGRLLQFVASETGMAPGSMRLTISSLHAFEGDKVYLESLVMVPKPDKRDDYNFGALG